jgi:hypothetical protein
MMNVIEFRGKTPRDRGSRPRLPPEDPDDIAELASRVASLQSKAKDEICNAILMLDLAAQHGREIAKRMRDPFTKERFDDQISMIEHLLQFTRDLALKL